MTAQFWPPIEAVDRSRRLAFDEAVNSAGFLKEFLAAGRKYAVTGLVLSTVVLLSHRERALAQTQKPSAKLKVEEGYFTGADQVKLFYRKLGAGSDFVVFLHGGPGASISDGGYLMEPLAQGHTLIMYDQRGGGRSDLVQQPELLTVDAEVRDLDALRQHFGIEKMALVGLSWGSGLAAYYAEAHPDRISRIVFLDPMPPANQPYVKERDEKMGSLLSPEDAARLQSLSQQMKTAPDDQIAALCRERDRTFLRLYLVHPERMGNSWDMCDGSPAALRNASLVFKAVVTSLGDFDIRPMLSRLKVPVLVIEGEKTNVPLDATREWAKAPPDARLLLIPDAGHAAFVDQTDAVLAAIQSFLGGKWPAGTERLNSPQ